METDVNGETSENDSVDKEKKDKNRGGRDKAIVKGKGKAKSKVAGTEMDVEWDHNLASVAVTLRRVGIGQTASEERIRFWEPLMESFVVSRLNEITCHTT